MSQILVTGGCGYIGSHVVRLLTEAGHEVTVFDNLSTGFADSLYYRERLVKGDLGDQEALDKLFSVCRFRTVIHLAGSLIVPDSVIRPLVYYENNVCSTLRLLVACARYGVCQFIFSSSSAVYGNIEGKVSEASPTVPINPYGYSKLICERMISDLAVIHPLRFIIMRYFNVAGADPQGRMGQRSLDATHIIKIACQAALGLRDKVNVYGTDFPTQDGTGVRDYVHVEDLAKAHLGALEYLENGGNSDTFNVGHGLGASVLQVIKHVQSISGIEFPIKLQPRRLGDPGSLVSCSKRINEVIGWLPIYSDLEFVVSSALQWEKSLMSNSGTKSNV